MKLAESEKPLGGGRSERKGLRPRLLYGGAALLVAGLAFGLTRRGSVDANGKVMAHTVQAMDLRVTALESGTVESASSVNVLSEVEGTTGILSLVPQGTTVEQGHVVVELDSSALRTRLTEQQIAVERARGLHAQAQGQIVVARSQAESDIRVAENAVEFARLDLKKYLEAEHPLLLRQLQTETSLAEEEVKRARVQLKVSEELRRDGYISDGELDADRLRATRAEFRVDMAKEQERKLRDYDHPQAKRVWESKVAEAESALARTRTQAEATVQQVEKGLATEKSTLALEEGKLRKIESQIEKCTMRAPQAGVVVYPFPEDNDRVELIIKQGTSIALRQHVFSIPDTDVLQVRTSTHEALVSQVKPGMPARVWIDVLPDVVLRGDVADVSGEPDPADWRRTTVKFYETKVRLLDRAEGLKLGMTARVEILIDELRGVLALPVQALVQRGERGVCYVLRGGSPELRRLRLGKSSVEHVEVKEGLVAGERVVLSPDALGIPADAFEEPAAATPAVASQAETPPPDPAASQPAPPEEPLVEVQYEAALVGPGGGTAKVEFEIQTQGGKEVKRKLDVEVAGGPPDATLEVSAGGVVIGTVLLDATGSGMAKWTTKRGTFPPNFPADAGPGMAVAIGGDFQGVLGNNTK
ncbi:MAG TPA: HlyD family efflux transporter periplasmic adaptor subunit [Planctomycetota bacterium]|jgi:HlyD family secretion protein|nr:HlyD family efflux transporter periplasmic adaptor subunit [Planctomycetota bacterium]